MARARLLIAGGVALAAAALFAADPRLPENPHAPLGRSGGCPECHAYTKLGEMLPHEFVVSIPEKCWVCHLQESLGRSHPIGVDPRSSSLKIEVPEEIPLENDCVSCGSCHTPHGEWLSLRRSYRDQEAFFTIIEGEGKNKIEIPYYKTYYLRVPGDPEEGFTPLCQNTCHTDY
jgi:ferredoxin